MAGTRAAGLDAQESPVATGPVEPAASPSGPHIVLVKAMDVDVAAAARAVTGVTRVTRESGEIWNISADHDVSAEVARRIADKGLLKLLVSVKPGEQGALMQFLARQQA